MAKDKDLSLKEFLDSMNFPTVSGGIPIYGCLNCGHSWTTEEEKCDCDEWCHEVIDRVERKEESK